MMQITLYSSELKRSIIKFMKISIWYCIETGTKSVNYYIYFEKFLIDDKRNNYKYIILQFDAYKINNNIFIISWWFDKYQNNHLRINDRLFELTLLIDLNC